MLTEEAKLKWANYFAKQAEELNIPENQRNVFIQATLFGTHRYSLMLMKRLAQYGDDYEKGLCSKRDIGQRVFKHNNCLPCKNMQIKDMKAVKKHYPANHNDAMNLSVELKKYWGRVEDDFYFTFGRDLGQESTCEACRW